MNQLALEKSHRALILRDLENGILFSFSKYHTFRLQHSDSTNLSNYDRWVIQICLLSYQTTKWKSRHFLMVCDSTVYLPIQVDRNIVRSRFYIA
jgi:hypothetical protein